MVNKIDADEAMGFYNLSEDEWNSLSEIIQQKLIKKVIPRTILHDCGE